MSDVAVLDAKQKAMEKRFDKMEVRLDEHLDKLYTKVDELSTTFNRRPAWPVAVIITVLSSGFFTILGIFLTQ